MKATHLLTAAGLAVALAAHAQTAPASADDHAAHHPAATSAAPASAAWTDGEVRKVDAENGKLTLRHGPIANLNMPGMTMVFKLADPKLIDGLKVGDKLRFTAQNVNGALTVTSIEPAAK